MHQLSDAPVPVSADVLSDTKEGRRFLRPRDVERYYGLRIKTLEAWRRTNDGPKFASLSNGRMILYDVVDIEAWLADRKVRNNAEAHVRDDAQLRATKGVAR